MNLIFTDGSCRGNPGPGSYAAIFVRNGTPTHIMKGYVPDSTTNNRMELIAIIMALEVLIEKRDNLKGTGRIILYTDSLYAVNGINQYLKFWVVRNFKNVKNSDLWITANERIRMVRELYEDQGIITFTWLKGHDTHRFNVMADEVCQGMHLRQLGKFTHEFVPVQTIQEIPFKI